MTEKDELFLRKEIDNIINHFDFTKVEKVMNFLDWKIRICIDGGCEMVIPNIQQLIKEARERLLDVGNKAVDNDEPIFSHSGPFKARAYYDKEEENPFVLELMFVVEYSESW